MHLPQAKMPDPGSVNGRCQCSRRTRSVLQEDHICGFGGKGRLSADGLERAIRAGVEEAAGEQRDRLVPYVQRHEFKGLLFADVSAFEVLPDIPRQAIRSLEAIRSAFATPEDINDSARTASGKRIVRAVPRIRKRVHGPDRRGDRHGEDPRGMSAVQCLARVPGDPAGSQRAVAGPRNLKQTRLPSQADVRSTAAPSTRIDESPMLETGSRSPMSEDEGSCLPWQSGVTCPLRMPVARDRQ